MCAIPKGTHKSISFEKGSKREKKGELETHKLQRVKKRVECAKSMKGRATRDLTQVTWVNFSLDSGGEGEKNNSRDDHFGWGKRKQPRECRATFVHALAIALRWLV